VTLRLASIRAWRLLRSRALPGFIASSVALVTTTFPSRDAEAYAIKKAASGEVVHWETPEVHYTYDPSFDATVDTASMAAARAMVSWSGSVGAPNLRGFHANEVIGAPTNPGFDQKNGIFFIPKG
jgi:hypothetical protein